jgi:fructose-1,6-bisphosphatase I
VNDTQGKLRLSYEANAIAFLAEQARGSPVDGRANTLDVLPASLTSGHR